MTHTQLNRFYLVLPAILMMLIVAGCSIGTVHFERSAQVERYFEQQELLPDHDYYVFGHFPGPDAIVGIKEGWTLESTKWKKMERDAQLLKNLVQRIKNIPGAEYNLFPNGAYIYNDDGETIGVWYSAWVLPVLKFTGEKTFVIWNPKPILPNNYRNNDGGNDRVRARG